MPCYKPITALQPTAGGPLLFPKEEHLYLYNDYRTIQIGCGQCRGCRMKRKRNWAIRCLHEKMMHKHSCFITLTYAEQKLPPNNSLDYKHFQAFMRRLRKKAKRTESPPAPKGGGSGGEFNINTTLLDTRTALYNIAAGAPPKAVAHPLHCANAQALKFYMAGEYGELYGRPHYHALIFGLDFADKVYQTRTPSGEKIYRSPTLEKLWKHGYSSVGELTYKSAAYVARYVMKKRTGDGQTTDYEILDPETGELWKKKKEFNNMSRRPGVGKTWLEKYENDVYATGKVIANGHPQNPPRYYDKLYKKIDQAALEEFQYARLVEARAMLEHQTPERLAVQEQVAAARERSLKRNLN